MRVLFVTYPENSNVKLIAPLAWAFGGAGHDVRIAGHPESADYVRNAGLTAVPLGRDHVLWSYLRRRPHLIHEKVQEVPFYTKADAPEADLSWEFLTHYYDSMVPAEYRLTNDPLLYRLVEFCREWRPDLVLWQSTLVAGAVAAEACGAAHVRLPWAMDMDGRYRSRFAELKEDHSDGEARDALKGWLEQRAARFGVGFHEELVTGQLTIDQLPQSMRLRTGLPTSPMRFVPYSGSAAVPEWMWRTSARPRLCVTLGATVRERLGLELADVNELLQALGGLDAEVVATFAAHEREGLLKRVPDNVRIVEFIPFSALLPTCSAIVHHGGIGVFCTALASGVPQLVLPDLYDTPARSARLVEAGGGLSIAREDVGRRSVLEAAEKLLDSPSFTAAAAGLQDEVAAMPAPSTTVERLEQHVADRSAGRRPVRARPEAVAGNL